MSRARFIAIITVSIVAGISMIYFVTHIPFTVFIEGSVVSVSSSNEITKIVLDTNIDTEYLVVSKDMKLNPGIGDYIHLEYNNTLFVTSGYRINQIIV